MKKFLASFTAVALAAAFVVTPVQGATIAELQAMIASLQSQLSALSGGTATSGGYNFATNLTIGSKGADVTALQNWLIANGHAIAAGATGYFGAQTKAAVIAWQTSAGITPAAGYFGPISRAKLNGMAAGTTPTTPGTVVVGGITTPGVEGTISVTSSPVSTGSVYEGDSMVSVLAFKARAQTSDIALQRVKLDLGTVTTIYNKIYSKVYLVDADGKTLASSDLNSSTVVKDGSIYYITLSGFSSVVPKDTTKVFTIKMDVRPSIDSTDLAGPYTVRVAANGVRGIDGAGIDQFSPANATDVTKSFAISASLVDAASLTLSTNVSSPLTQEVVASLGSGNNELDGVTLLTFDIKAEKDAVLLTDLVAGVTKVGAGATASSTYLYVGSTQIGSASAVAAGTATFSDIDYTIPKDTTKTFTLKADIRGASSVQTTFAATVANSGLTAENSNGDSVTKSGSATGNNILVSNVGPVFTLVGTPTITKTSTPVQNNYSTSTLSATFQLQVQAVGGAILFGTNASGTPMVSNVTLAGNKSFITYLGGAANTQVTASSTDFTFPSSGSVVATGSNSVTLAEGATIVVPVTFTFQGNLSTGVGVTNGSYAFGLERVNWVNAEAGTLNASTFMSGLTGWRTAGVSLP